MKIIKELIPYVVIVLLVLAIRTYFITPVRVVGDSMYPTLHDEELLLLNKYKKEYQRNDIVVIDCENEKIIKRIIALPGETVEYKNDTLYINGKKHKDVVSKITEDFSMVKLKDNEYFVMGDNRAYSKDSRTIGPVKIEDINGSTKLRIFPLNKIGNV